jgi:hypothetical protein
LPCSSRPPLQSTTTMGAGNWQETVKPYWSWRIACCPCDDMCLLKLRGWVAVGRGCCRSSLLQTAKQRAGA